MNRTKIIVYSLIVLLIILGIYGLFALFVLLFLASFHFLTDLMVNKGANTEIAPIVSLILTVVMFLGYRKAGTTIINKVEEYGGKRKR